MADPEYSFFREWDIGREATIEAVECGNTPGARGPKSAPRFLT